eukprot:TRINITY_DN22827_c0_g1_i1.p1 TRINITY_DN22827_c0_g1~~TRINITY_DN22827_c0_g1_i1.p1  ORF type:complete len:465 (+),score=48.53 TRINITY_DN22827_c0_g1_i1:241-1635(+)
MKAQLTGYATGEVLDPKERYQTFCRWAEDGSFYDGFRDLSSWEMRYVVGSWCTSQELEWARENVVADCRTNECMGKAGGKMVTYRLENDEGESVHGDNFYGGRPVTLEEMASTGGVCGAVSKFSAGVCQAFGVPAMPVTQPGHCAHIWQAERGRWVIGNDCAGWAKSGRHWPVQIPDGNSAWHVPLMQQAQMDFESYSKSERARWLANIAASASSQEAEAESPLSGASAWLFHATSLCCYNYAAWLDLISLVGRCCDGSRLMSWVEDDWIRLSYDDENCRNLSHARPVEASDCHDRQNNVTDGTSSEWWTGDDTAWLQIQLAHVASLRGVRIQWWGISDAKTFRILSSEDGEHFTLQRTNKDVIKFSAGYNCWVEVPGWETPTKLVRLELEEGRADPWGMKKMFGIRQVVLSGREVEAFDLRVPCEAKSVLRAKVKATFSLCGKLEQAVVSCVVADLWQRLDAL